MGPASSPKEILRKMFEAGLDVCRLNFSHGKHEDHLKTMNTIRELNEEMDLNVAILADLQGPKLRVGDMENNGVFLEDGKTFNFVTTESIGTKEQAYLTKGRASVRRPLKGAWDHGCRTVAIFG